VSASTAPTVLLDTGPWVALLERGVLRIGMALGEETAAVKALFERHGNLPASLADACLVRMSELYSACRVFTLDSDFHTGSR
jgi:predicted nucleic acid-binding protein